MGVQVCVHSKLREIIFFFVKPKVCAVLVRVSRLTLVVVGEEVEKSSRRFDFGVLVGTMSSAVQIYSRRQPKWIIIERPSFGNCTIALDYQVLVFPSFQN